MQKKKNLHKMKSEDFNLNRGKVIDTLNTDYPYLFTEVPDFSIYIKDMEVSDPSGIVFSGIRMYKALFTMLRFFRSTVINNHELKYKINYDSWDQNVAVRWSVVLHTSTPAFKSPLTVDGISRYHLNWEGQVYKHEVSNIQVIGPNGYELNPPYF